MVAKNILIMPITITDIDFKNQAPYSTTGSTNALMGCIGDLMEVEIDFTVAWNTLATNMTFTAATKKITRNDVVGSFITDGFQVGDTIKVTGTVSNNADFTVVTVEDLYMTVSQTIVGETAASTNIYGISQVAALDFYYNMVGNNDQKTFVSKTDSVSLQKYTLDITSVYSGSYDGVINSTSHAWAISETDAKTLVPVVVANGFNATYGQDFTLTFGFIITPFFKSGMLQLLQNAKTQIENTTINSVDFIPPAEFLNQCMGFAYQIDAKYALTNSRADQSSGIQFKNGNTAWFNSFFPSGVKNGSDLITKNIWKRKSLTYEDQATNVIDAIDYNEVTDVTFVLTPDIFASPDDTIAVINFAWLPNDPAAILGYSEDDQLEMREVFLWDRCLVTVGGNDNGDMFGTDYQAITNAGLSHDGTDLTVSFQIDLGAVSKQVFGDAGDGNRNYIIWVTPEEGGITTALDSLRSAILIDVNEAWTDNDDDTLLDVISTGNNILFYGEADAASPKSDFVAMLGSYGLSKCQFQVKENTVIKNINLKFETVVYTKTLEEYGRFTIQEWNNPTEQYWDGKLTNINIVDFAGFDLPNDNPFQKRSIKRKSSLDSAGFWAYEMFYGFQLGYQFWQNVENFSDVFLKYHTQYWAAYTQGRIGSDGNSTQGDNLIPDFTSEIKMTISWDIYDPATDYTTTFNQEADITCYDQYGNFISDIYSAFAGAIKTYDVYGADTTGMINPSGLTQVEATFEDTNTVTTIGSVNTIGVLYCYYETGNGKFFDRIDTDGNLTPNTVWSGTPSLTYQSYSVIVSCILDFSSLGEVPKNVRLYAKILY